MADEMSMDEAIEKLSQILEEVGLGVKEVQSARALEDGQRWLTER